MFVCCFSISRPQRWWFEQRDIWSSRHRARPRNWSCPRNVIPKSFECGNQTKHRSTEQRLAVTSCYIRLPHFDLTYGATKKGATKRCHVRFHPRHRCPFAHGLHGSHLSSLETPGRRQRFAGTGRRGGGAGASGRSEQRQVQSGRERWKNVLNGEMFEKNIFRNLEKKIVVACYFSVLVSCWSCFIAFVATSGTSPFWWPSQQLVCAGLQSNSDGLRGSFGETLGGEKSAMSARLQFLGRFSVQVLVAEQDGETVELEV